MNIRTRIAQSISASAICLIGFCVAGCRNPELAAEKKQIRIGVVLPLSGSMAEYGRNGQRGLTLAKQEIEGESASPKIDLQYEDTKDAPQDTVSAVHRLIDVSQVKFIIGGLTSSGVLAAAPYAQQKGVLFFSPAASAPGIPQIGNLIFRNWPSDDDIAKQYGKAAFTLGIKSTLILHVANDYGKVNSDAFNKAFTIAGGNVILTRAFPQGTTDFKAIVSLVLNHPEAQKIFVIAYPDEYKAFFQELDHQGGTASRVMTSDTFYSPSLASDLGKKGNGILVGVAAKPKGYAPREDFIKAYGKAFTDNGKPAKPGLVSDTAYDALKLLASAIRKTDGSPSAVSTWMLANTKDYRGASGPITFKDIGDVSGKLALYVLKDGSFAEQRF